MAKNQSTFTAELRIKAIIDEAQKELNTFGDSLQKAWAGGEPPKSLNKAFEQMRIRLESIKEISKKGVVNTSDLRRAEQDYQSFSKDIHNLSVEFKLMSTEQKRVMLSKEEQDNIRARAAAIKEYTAALEKNNKIASQIESLKKEKDDIKAGQARRSQAETTVKDIEPRLNRLKSAGGPLVLSKEAQEYKNTLKEQIELLAKVEQAQARVNSLSKKGLKEGGNNQLTEARKELEKLQEQQKKFNNLAGKSEYEEALSKYNQEIASLENKLSSANEDLAKMDAEFAEIDEQLKKLSVKDLTSEFDALKKHLKELGVEGIDDAKDITELRKAVQDLDNKAIAGVDEEIKKMISELKKMGSTALQAKQGIDQATDSIEQQKEAMRNQEAFESKIKSFLGLSGAAQVLRAALRDAMQTITELDAVMGQMAVVTDLTVGDYWDQLPEYSERASKLGVSITSAYEAATLYYQQGLKANEVTALSEQTLKMAAIAGLDAADATDRMTAALRGFNMELNEANAQNIADVYSELAAITAADVDEISTAMTKTASIASSAGMEFETTAAFLSQIIETTRESAETAGTAMKTVIARFQELKKSPSEIGEIDGEIVDANAIETALRSVGVSLRDSAGQFRELDDVFLELSSKWDGLDKNTQRYIATIAAGSRQQSRFIAMMSDYKRTTELVTAANTSAGASNKQFEKTMDTLEYKVNQLKNAWHEFTMGIMNSDLVKFGVDVLTKFLEVVNKATSALDGVGGSLTKIISVVGIFKLGKQIFDKFMPTISGFFTNVTKEAYTGGLNAGKAFQQGLEDSKQQSGQPIQQQGASQEEILRTGYTRDKNGRLRGPDGKFAKESDGKRTKLEKLGDKTIGLSKWQQGNKHGQNRKKELEELKKLKKGTKEYEEQQKKVLAEGQKQWKAYGAAVGQVGQTMTGTGMAMSAIGGIMSSLGLEEVGETLSSIGNVIMIIGSGVSALGPLVVKLVAKLVAGGLSTMAAWSWVAGIALGVTALVAGAVALFNSIKNNSPEAKLKKAQEAAEKATEAAEQAKEAYEGLTGVFDSLSDKYTVLEELIKGTREWNESILEINKSVMDLIKQYPELTKFVEYTDGVLKIDFEKQEVQNILDEALKTSVGAQNISTAADIAVLEAQANKDRANLDANFKYDTQYIREKTDKGKKKTRTVTFASEGGAREPAGTEVPLYLNDEQKDILAKAVANGALVDKDSDVYKNLDKALSITENQLLILEESIAESQDAIEEYGRSLLEKERQEKVMYNSMANSVVNLVDTMGMSEERIKQMFNVADGTDYQQAYDEVFDKISGSQVDFLDDSGDEDTFEELANNELKGLMTEQDIKDAFTAAGYKNISVNNDKGYYEYTDSEGETQKITDESEIERILASYYASTVVKKRAENSGAYISRMADYFGNINTFKKEVTNEAGEKKTYTASGEAVASAFEKALQDETGSLLTAADLEALNALSESDWSDAFEQLPQVLKDAYGSVDNLKEEAKNAMIGAEYVSESGFAGVNAGAAKALNKIREATGPDKSGDFTTGFNTIMANTNIAQADKDFISQQIASLSSDPKNREAWDAVREKLADYGEAVTNFIGAQQTVLDTRYSDTYLKNLGVSDAMIANYNNATGDDLANFHETFKKWKKNYDTVNSETKKAEHELMERTIEAIVENREKQIAAYEEAVNAEAEANSTLIAKISENVARLRELREQEEAQKAISENLSQQAYLAMDTSGANALKLQTLQQEEKQLVQDYEDSLVDQAITKLEEDNEKALEQREQQIELMREQLDIYANSEQIQEDAKQMIDDATTRLANGLDISDSALAKILTPDNLQTEFAKAEFWSTLVSELSTAAGITNSGEGDTGQKLATQARTDALDKVIDESGASGTVSSETYFTERENYIAAGGEGADFDRRLEELGIGVRQNKTIGYNDNEAVGDYSSGDSIFNDADLEAGENDVGVVKYGDSYYKLKASGKNKKAGFSTDDSEEGKLEVVTVPGSNKAQLYINFNGTGYEIIDEYDRNDLLEDMKLQAYATGGLADFTGPAWLDGTKSRPEYVLNADQTERFFSLIDVLESFNKNSSTSEKHGDNYFDININVDKLENDYDVEQIADKIRRMIYDDATYRNVNTINHIR